MAGMGRASSFLPTVKCSMCAKEIEISQMGDHICGGSGEPTPPPESSGNFTSMPYKSNLMNAPSSLPLGRAIPPRVDTSAANRPFFRQDQLTPVSLSPSRSLSPMTPNEGRQSPFGRPMRSGTAPILRRTPSPEPLSSNLDCAFPPFPTKQNAPVRSQTGGGYGGMGKFAQADPRYAPVSPRTATSGGLLQRMNTIAPGPFDPNRRTPGENKSDRIHKRNGTIGSLKDMTMSSATNEIGSSIRRLSTAGPGHSRTSTNSSNESRSAVPPPRAPRTNGYGGFGPPGTNDPEPISAESRSQTFPSRSAVQPTLRRPSEPGPGPAQRLRRPSNEGSREAKDDDRSSSRSSERGRKPSFSGPDTSRVPPPRSRSLVRSRVDGRLGDAPPVPVNLNLAAEFGIGNPYHTPSVSQSSSASNSSAASKASSTSSPPLSTGARPSPTKGQSRWQPSDTKIDVLMADVESSMASLNPREIKASPPRNNKQYARGLQSQPKLDPFMLSPESPMDATIQGGRFSPSATRQRLPSPDKAPTRRPTTAKGNCKGCSLPIKGRSVSSADGRLTGRYHKDCFICRTCSEPFQTSTFYVINDAPYCERHYHKLNGSICNNCDKGIEGQYLESERKQKFHPTCLTCADCKRMLRNDYFEMNGQVYCERDAFRRAQQGKFLGTSGQGSNRMERRTTRLMVM